MGNMKDLIDFLVEITENTDISDDPEWHILRPLSSSEIRLLQDIDEAWHALEILKSCTLQLLTPERRKHVRSRWDFTDKELELLGRLMLARDVFLATRDAFWSLLIYEFRRYHQLQLDRDKETILGRGHLRLGSPIAKQNLEPVGNPDKDELSELARLLGEK